MTRLVRRALPPGWDTPGDWPDHVTPLLRRIYAARGAHAHDLARPRLAQLPSPALMGGMDAATALLEAAIAGLN